jgi:ECF transporter S component (folate family)
MLRIKTIALAGLMIALSIVLTRMLAINVTNEIRISFGNFPILLSGILFGAGVGAVVGFSADFIGANTLGIGWNPMLTISPIIIGVVAGLFSKWLKRRFTYVRLVSISSIGYILGPIIWTTYVLSKMYASSILPLFVVRVPIYVVTTLIDCLLVILLCRNRTIQQMLCEYWNLQDTK